MQFTINTDLARSAWLHYRADMQARRDRFCAMAVDEIASRPLPTGFFKKPSPLTTEQIDETIRHETSVFGATGIFRDIQKCDFKIGYADQVIDDLALLTSAGVTEIVYQMDEFRPAAKFLTANKVNGGRHANAA